MSNKDTSLTDEAICSDADLTMDSTYNIPVSEVSEDDLAFLNAISDDEDDPEVTQRCSRTSSLCDDSGFNSSTSEDREDVVERVLRQKCDLKGDTDLVDGHSDGIEHNTQCLLHQSNKLHDCVNQTDSELLITNFEVNPTEDSDTLNIHHINSVSNSNISVKNCGRISRRQRTDNGISMVVAQTANSRMPRNRRQRQRDINNNDSSHRNFNSYIGKPQFKLQDCFQDQGLVSFLVCIIYTLFLMVVFCILGGISESLKSAIGKENLKYIQQDIVQSRRSRTSMASG